MFFATDRVCTISGTYRSGTVLAVAPGFAWVLWDGAEQPETVALAELSLESQIPAAEPVAAR